MSRKLEITIGAVVLVAVTMILTALVLWRSKPTIIVVEDRWWTTWTSVKYDVTTVELVPVTRTTCTGYGDSRSCTTTTTAETRIRTTTHTRCTTAAQGRELPISHPEPGCKMRPGDYLGYSQAFRMAYHVEEQAERLERAFVPELWGVLEPGTAVTVRWSAAGTVREAMP